MAFRRVSTMFIAALGDPKASNGTGAELWGLWPVDPGPRGVRLSKFGELAKVKTAPTGWAFDPKDFWVEEHGLIMEAPIIPIVPVSSSSSKKFIVTGDREITTVLTIFANGQWKLDEGCLHDVTHLPCRSARYIGDDMSFVPCRNDLSKFPVVPGAIMPSLPTCTSTDYAVLFVTAVGVDDDKNKNKDEKESRKGL
jgi:hypothetical protein